MATTSEPEPGGVDWLDLGPDPDEGKPPRDPRRRYLWYGGAAALVVAVLLTRTQHGANSAATSPRAPSSPSATVPSSSAVVSASAAAPSSSGSFVNPSTLTPTRSAVPVQVSSAGHRLLDVPADWELFARSEDSVIRIQLALGRITTTAIPRVAGNGSVMFLAGADRAIVSTLGDPSSSVVRDGKPAADLPQSFRQNYLLLPGPDSRHLWAGQEQGLSLVNLDGKPTGATIEIPTSGSPMGSDGAGYVVLSGIAGGAYYATPGAVHRITHGVLLASGPTRWLATECDDSLSCSLVVIDRASGARHPLGMTLGWYDQNQGIISPDGKTAALPRPNDGVSAGAGVDLLDLSSGTERPALTTLHTSDGAGPSFVWAPDSSRLFAVDVNQRIVTIDRNTGRATPLGTKLPQVLQLAFRHRTG